RVEVGLHFGMLLGDRLAESHLFSDVDAVVPVPLHWMRRWKRGYNQAEVIASGVARRLGVPMKNDILRRCRRTRTQTRLNIAEKRKNVTGAFDVSDKARSNEELKHLLIVDDVFTTGSTLMACFVALREVFPPSVRISVATLGFVGGT
ncbi:MAG TPA: phosphoribosyltransferase family protein, partial [Methanocorpusculum sp.]|nr:phosphoribosyltransferase family protein [Methanocorpusculum sp.]